MAGVSNIGADRNWTGSQFDQANWYVFGRLAWNPALSSRDIAEEWVRMTFSNDARFVAPAVAMMMGSREAVVDYMTPLGLAHLMASGHHYGPGAWQSDGARADWTPPYYHRADAQGIGYDRSTTGSNAVSQYAPALAAAFSDPSLTPEKYLLWFHHLPWDFPMTSGHTLWDRTPVIHYTRGVDYVRQMPPHLGDPCSVRGLGAISLKPRPISAFRKRRRSGGATRRWRISKAYRSAPFPKDSPVPDTRCKNMRRSPVPYAPGNPGWTAAPLHR